MTHVIIIGRSSLGITDEISAVMKEQGVTDAQGAITYSPDLCCVGIGSYHQDSPRLVVRDTDRTRAIQVGKALNSRFNIDVEVEVVDGFLPASGPAFS